MGSEEGFIFFSHREIAINFAADLVFNIKNILIYEHGRLIRKNSG